MKPKLLFIICCCVCASINAQSTRPAAVTKCPKYVDEKIIMDDNLNCTLPAFYILAAPVHFTETFAVNLNDTDYDDLIDSIYDFKASKWRGENGIYTRDLAYTQAEEQLTIRYKENQTMTLFDGGMILQSRTATRDFRPKDAYAIEATYCIFAVNGRFQVIISAAMKTARNSDAIYNDDTMSMFERYVHTLGLILNSDYCVKPSIYNVPAMQFGNDVLEFADEDVVKSGSPFTTTDPAAQTELESSYTWIYVSVGVGVPLSVLAIVLLVGYMCDRRNRSKVIALQEVHLSERIVT